ncbi:hypothetical protein R6Q57_017773 [Mikania cordata]
MTIDELNRAIGVISDSFDASRIFRGFSASSLRFRNFKVLLTLLYVNLDKDHKMLILTKHHLMDSIASPTISDQQHSLMYMTDTPADVVRRWFFMVSPNYQHLIDKLTDGSFLPSQFVVPIFRSGTLLMHNIQVLCNNDANYLNIIELLDLICEKVVYLIKGKTPEVILKMFNIKNDFILEEEDECFFDCCN